MSCLIPALATIPKGDWICDACIISTGADYGFEMGREYSLESYRIKADEFKRRWFKRKDLLQQESVGEKIDSDDDEYGSTLRLEDRVEKEFWRLTESQTETVEIEYGADLHSSKYGRYAVQQIPCLMLRNLIPY